MKLYETSKIKNFCLLGHGNSGKTSLAEAILNTAGSIERMGKTQDGNTVMDFDPEEIKRKFSISAAVATCDWNGTKFNIIDTPGFFDFVGEVQQSIKVADAAIIVLSGKSGLTVGAEKAWKYAEDAGIPKMIFINKVDDERVNYYGVLDQLREKYGKKIAPLQVPIREGEKITGFVNVVEGEARRYMGDMTVTAPIPDGMEDDIAPVREMINEAVAESSEELMERYFAGESFTLAETYEALRNGVAAGDIVPVLCGSAFNKLGIASLMNAIVAYFPSPDSSDEFFIAHKEDGSDARRKVDVNDPLAALVFKTVADPYVGKLSYFKVYSGIMTPDTTVYNSVSGTKTLVHLGDVVAVEKIVSIKYEIAVVIICTFIFEYFTDHKVHGIAFTLELVVKTFIYNCTMTFCNFKCFISAVVSSNIYINEMRRIILRFHRINQLTYNCFFVSRRYKNCIPFSLISFFVNFWFYQTSIYHIYGLIRIKQTKNNCQCTINNV